VRVALVHDYLNQYGGAERVLEVFHELYPNAPVYTSLYEPTAMPAHFRGWDIRTSFMQRIPLARAHHRHALLLYPLAFESFDLSSYDVVISNSSAWCKGVKTPPGTMHLSYCLTPMRFAWNLDAYVDRERLGRSARTILPTLMHGLRRWDVANSRRVDRFVGISRVVVERIRQCYGRDADLLMPPVDVESIPLSREVGDEYLVVSRLIPYKRIDLAIEACNRLGAPLCVVGDGRDRASLEALAGPSVRFAGFVADQEARAYRATCRAFLFPGEEDFGIAPVEAMAAGRPVIAFAGGGALDTVVDGETGALFSPQSADALAATLAAFDPTRFDPERIRAHALGFATSTFKKRFADLVDDAYRAHRASVRFAQTERAPV
jgi:glycosyltransferase involved in cell wall biosynthesis